MTSLLKVSYTFMTNTRGWATAAKIPQVPVIIHNSSTDRAMPTWTLAIDGPISARPRADATHGRIVRNDAMIHDRDAGVGQERAQHDAIGVVDPAG
jgi:hypothetical protein